MAAYGVTRTANDIQDAVVAANALAGPLKAGRLEVDDLAAV